MIISNAALLVLLITGSSVLAQSMQRCAEATLTAMRMQCLSVAEAGAERAFYYLRTQAPHGAVTGSWLTAGRTVQMSTLGSYTLVV